jgi:hypothetical protein
MFAGNAYCYGDRLQFLYACYAHSSLHYSQVFNLDQSASQSRVRNYLKEGEAWQLRFHSGNFVFIEWTGNPYGL